ncbi:MAG: LL-diaminopimelate aminotransferase [Candidatus Brocadia sapporoensis]|nr:aminotransferase class I/II-fold pyridoxal phosphate-dependent enzyme [Candidatus Brocadia sapporoensis]MDG6006133.1 aminotransferase class I/II-fold pyridoxal phosphate-dependent enzyme [Candidatus Brocadia sp.]GJQ23534.1 MAG: LL-diaminopimelate aminotransferase [Candidatus Brocadia sapporoensis]
MKNIRMEITASKRLQSIGAYAFAEVDKEVEKLKAMGITPIDFGVGDPTVPTPDVVRKATQKGITLRKSSGYPSYIGASEFRQAIAQWIQKRFGVQMDPATEISSTIGSKEAVFNFPEGIVNPGDYVIIPTPGYPPYTRGTLFAEGIPYYVPLLSENKFLIDLNSIPEEICKKAKILWINYPNSPSGAIAPLSYLKEIVEFGKKYNIIIASDEAYSEIFFGEPPHSILEITKDGVIVFNSFSKRSAMTCYRVGWVAGDKRIVDIFKKVKTNIDSGTATFIQDGAIAALSDETHVEKMRAEYKVKRDLLVDAFHRIKLPDCTPEATIYLWQKVPDGMTSVVFAQKLLSPEIAIVTTPGAWISDKTANGLNPGEGYVRFALVPSIKDTREAARRIKKILPKAL